MLSLRLDNLANHVFYRRSNSSSAIGWQSVYSKHGVDPDRFQIKTLANGLVQEIVIDDSRRTRPVLTLGLKPLLDPADVFPKPSRTDSGKPRPNQLICFKTKASTPSQQLRFAFDRLQVDAAGLLPRIQIISNDRSVGCGKINHRAFACRLIVIGRGFL